MNNGETRTMRDAFLERIYAALGDGADACVVSADFGAPALDRIRAEYGDRFVNVGIAEQNCVNVSAGLALEGCAVYAFGIAAFMSMRAFEPLRSTASLAAQHCPLNLNVLGVGTGLSYDLSGPSHHCLEDVTAMRLLPHVEVFSPSDWRLAGRLADYSLGKPTPKYFRLDGKPLPSIYRDCDAIDPERGFHEFFRGGESCILATGYMTQVALRAARKSATPIGVIDVFGLTPRDVEPLWKAIRGYRTLVSVEEGFINRGGLDALVAQVLTDHEASIRLVRLGVDGRHLFELGGRERLHRLCGMDEEAILAAARVATRDGCCLDAVA
jgi:transketolase